MTVKGVIRRMIRQIRLLKPFVYRELREQVAGSHLGLVWAFLHPALLALLYWWVFDGILHLRIPVTANTVEPPFIAFLLAGLLPWLAFSDSVIRGAGAVIARRSVVTNLAFPYHVFPLAAVIASHISYFVVLLIFVLIYDGIMGQSSTIKIAGVCLLGLGQLPLAAGLALSFSALSVYLRDVLHLLPLFTQVLFYTAPLVYPAALIPKDWQFLLQWHPYAGFAESFQQMVLWTQWPDTMRWFSFLLLGFLSLFTGIWLFQRLRPGFADVL